MSLWVAESGATSGILSRCLHYRLQRQLTLVSESLFRKVSSLIRYIFCASNVDAYAEYSDPVSYAFTSSQSKITTSFQQLSGILALSIKKKKPNVSVAMSRSRTTSRKSWVEYLDQVEAWSFEQHILTVNYETAEKRVETAFLRSTR